MNLINNKVNTKMSQKEFDEMYTTIKKIYDEDSRYSVDNKQCNNESTVRTLNEITLIQYLKNAKLESKRDTDEYYDFLVVKGKGKNELLLNITTGEDLSNNNSADVVIVEGVTKVKKIYTFDPDVCQDSIDIGKIESAILYKTVDVHDGINYITVTDGTDVIEIKDENGTIFYIDTLFNEIYKKKNTYFLRKYTTTKQHILFKNGLENTFDIKNFNNLKFKFLSLFFKSN